MKNTLEEYPREGNQYEEIKSYLWSHGASSEAIESFKEGWLEYLKQYPGRIQPHAWCSKCGEKLDVEDSILAWCPALQELFVVDAKCLSGYMLDEMVSRPLSGITHVELEDLVEKDDVSEYEFDGLVESLKLWGVMPVTIKGCVYFIMSEENKEIKIGFTVGPVEKRLSSLQTAHPYKLQLLGTIPGTTEDEKSLHEQFANIRLQGEWFKPHVDLLAFVAVIFKGQSGTII